MCEIVHVRGKRLEAGLYRCDLPVPIIELFVDMIKHYAKAFGATYADMKKLVLYHEEGHHLQWTNVGSTSEADANTYALRKFIRTEGRTPSIPIQEWMRTSMKGV